MDYNLFPLSTAVRNVSTNYLPLNLNSSIEINPKEFVDDHRKLAWCYIKFSYAVISSESNNISIYITSKLRDFL